ncbi:MAG: phospholipase D-like domain-containing protein, partial [Eubacteriales bacterium]|nr:phospholipase D-like domain-containing protein [Eubacteriales bacterium]
IASDIYIETDEYDFYELMIKVKAVENIDSFLSNHDVVFDEIKETIIQGIRNAKYIIWAAVAWITDKDIVNELLNKKSEGVNIRIITSDESSNSYLIDTLSNNFDTVKIPCWGYNQRNRIHHKFCIIDFDYVMHGSYNWSKAAQNNEETLSTALDREYVIKFLDEFVSLYKQYG